MPALDDILRQKLQVLESRHQKRTLAETTRSAGVRVTRGGKTLVSFSCNDYLGLSHHPDVVRAVAGCEAAGAGASRLVTGNAPLDTQLESALAAYKNTEAACLFGSGYLANLGTIPALVGVGDLILADKFIHACMIDAARLSGATFMRFAHNNAAHCKMLLEANRASHHHCLILTETVFSMDGDRAPLLELKQLAREHDAWLMTDDAHGLGLVKSESVDIEMGTLSKAVGSYGGYVCGSQALVDYLRNAARSFVYSTALPPAVLAATLAALGVMHAHPELGEKALFHARYFTSLMELPPAQSAIVPVVLKENEKVLKASALLEEKGFLVAAIRPPTVQENTARLRFAFSALHEKSQIEAVAACLKESGLLCEL